MDKLTKNKTSKWICLIIELVIYFILFVVKKVISFDIISHLLMLAILGFNWHYFFDKTVKKFEYPKIQLIFLIIINLTISFCVSGKVLFLTDSVVSINIVSILLFILANIFVFPFACNYLYLIDNATIIDKKANIKDSKKFALKIFLISFLIMLVACLAFYPGNMTTDTTDQISQAMGDYQINNAHPAFNTIFVRILLSIWNNLFVIVVSCSLFFSLVLTHIYKYLYEQKVNEKFLYITLLVFLLSVNNLSLITMAWKDVPFTISMLWLTFETYKIGKYKEEYFKKNINILFFTLSMIGTYFFRHNGMFPFFIMILYLLFILFRFRSKVKILLTIVLCVGSVYLIKGPVYDYYDVSRGDVITGGSASFAAKGLGALIYYDGDLSEEDLETISKLADLDDLREFYYAYSSDTYSFEDIKFNEGIERLGVAKIYEMYIKHLFKNPAILVRDRLDGSNLLWSFETPKGGFNYKYDFGILYPDWVKDFDGFERNDGEAYFPKSNILQEGIKVYQKSVNKIILLDSIFWRCGFVLGILLLTLFWVIIRKVHILPMTFPTIISILFWLALLNHQSYRYLWFIFVNTFFFIIIALLERKNIKNKVVKK